ncbi:hypothetical protein [Paenibacillus koleovorans]|uniref:hypothetical protein n=1 Tax=Paenibacillus koleovorans TaxID=121608 RepID=UPI000FDC675C|nr:hypothetical protein [Paenibacillus koleovorans]
MSMPNVPDIKPEIILKRKEVVNLLLTSIALEEIGLSHIINAEAEKIQHLLRDRCLTIHEALKINNSVERMMRNIVSNQLLLQFKMTDVLRLDEEEEDILFDDDCMEE